MLSLEEAKNEVSNLISRLSVNDAPKFAQIVSELIHARVNETSARIEGLKALRLMAMSLRKEVGVSGQMSNEKIVWPSDGYFKISLPGTIVDSFLYDELEMQELQDKRLIFPDRFCGDCNSTNIEDTVYSSHSFSINEIDWIFNNLLPQFIDLTNKCLVDIGSRLGVVLYGAALFRPEIKSIYGIEINTEFCEIQLKTLKSLTNADKCHVVQGDFRHNLQLIGTADIIVMNNVFTFFADNETQTNCWKELRSALRSGSFLVHAHLVHSVTSHLRFDFKLDDWLELIYPPAGQNSKSEHEIYLYRIR